MITTRSSKRRDYQDGLSRIDLLALGLILFVLVGLLIPAWIKANRRSSKVTCIRNLMHIGLAFRMFSNDHNDGFPMQISTNLGGSREFNLSGFAFPHFVAISNYIASPKVLCCPVDSDQGRKWAASFAELKDETISYFVGLDATETNQASILIGDRNVTGQANRERNVLVLRTNDSVKWTAEIHVHLGNVGFGDGSVRQIGNTNWPEILGRTRMEAIRLSIPP